MHLLVKRNFDIIKMHGTTIKKPAIIIIIIIIGGGGTSCIHRKSEKIFKELCSMQLVGQFIISVGNTEKDHEPSSMIHFSKFPLPYTSC